MRWLRKQICSLKRVGGVFSCVNKGQQDNNKGAAQSKPDSKPSGKPELNVAFAEKGI